MNQTGFAIVGALSLAACQGYSAQQEPTGNAVLAASDGAPDFVTGVCGECHAVTAEALSPNPQAPGFADIVNSPGVTRESLATFLADAHNYPMQMDVDLVEEDIDLIADYMMTLQSEDYFKRPS